MKNKAFTLVELLAVIVILGILGVVIIPKVGDSISNSKQTALITQEEQIKKATNDFIIENTELFETTDTISIKLGTLKQQGYLPINIKNPSTRKNISNESTITITKINNKFEISLNLIDQIEASENIGDNTPIIVLTGNYVEYVNINADETEVNQQLVTNGAKAYTSIGQEISNITTQIKIGNTEQSSIRTNAPQTYTITYSATDGNNKTVSSTRTVIIRDAEAPTITLPKETTLHVSELADFDLMEGVNTIDNYSQTVNITTNGTLANIPGNYVITYTATDSSGNATTERRVINVNNNYDVYYANLEYIESTGTQYIDTGVKANQNTGFDIDFNVINKINNVTGEFGTLLGARNTYKNSGFQLTTFNETTLVGHFLFGTNNTAANIRYSTGIIPGTRQQVSFKNRVLTSTDGSTTTVTNYTFTTPSNLTIFALNQNGTIAELSKTKLYNLKLYNGNTLIRNFIPCMRKKDSEIGLYDLINNKFYTNSGTGKFEYKLLGENPFERKYTKMQYIETTGTQYIDTRYIPDQNTKIEMDYNATASAKWLFGSRTASSNSDTFGAFLNTDTQYWIRIGANSDASDHKLSVASTIGRHKIYATASTFTQDDTTTLNYTANNTQGSYSIYIGTMNTAGALDNRMFTGRLYGFKIWNNNDLIRNYVPCMRNSDDTVGLCETINDTFYTNEGTGEFGRGNLIN